MRIPGLSTYLSLRKALFRYVEFMAEYLLELKEMRVNLLSRGQSVESVEEEIAAYEVAGYKPDPNMHGKMFIRIYGTKPMDRATSSSLNGIRGVKMATDYCKQAFEIIHKISSCLYDNIVPLTGNRKAMAVESGRIRLAVGQAWADNEIDRQSSRKKVSLTDSDKLELRLFILNLKDKNINRFTHLALENLGGQTMACGQEQRIPGILNLDAHMVDSQHCTPRQQVPQMLQMTVTLKRSKLLHAFTKVGMNATTTMTVATHRNALFSTDVALALHFQEHFEVRKNKVPDFAGGHDACKNCFLFPGSNESNPISNSTMNKVLKRGLIHVGKYFPGLVGHHTRTNGSEALIRRGCGVEHIEKANWSLNKKPGKKPVFLSAYNEGYSKEFVVVNTDHGVAECFERYHIPWDVEVPASLLAATWPFFNEIIALVDSGAPGFANNHGMAGLVRSIKQLKGRLYTGCAHLLYTGSLREDDPILNHQNFKSAEFLLLRSLVKLECDKYARVLLENEGRMAETDRECNTRQLKELQTTLLNKLAIQEENIHQLQARNDELKANMKTALEMLTLLVHSRSDTI
ncbi:hypothetical protein BDR26DRAFT_944457 [Obelidium mucronatum]|nr:hypothetical protein BDR26DRAFT_944457 [Obelidium mucronatum]